MKQKYKYIETVTMRNEAQYFFQGVTREQELYDVDVYEDMDGNTFIQVTEGEMIPFRSN